MTAEWFKVSCGPDYALTISYSADGQTWTDLESAPTHDQTLARSTVRLAGLSAARGDDGSVKVDQVGLAP